LAAAGSHFLRGAADRPAQRQRVVRYAILAPGGGKTMDSKAIDRSDDLPRHGSGPNVAARLGLWDTVSIILGIVVGTAIFRSSTVVFQSVSGPAAALGVWLVGGIVSWCGAVCYAELATAFPRDGGDYEYLSRAFGRWCGFLFGWAQLTTVISGNIGIMAYAFADYGVRHWPAAGPYAVWLAIVPIVALSLLNSCGVVAGKVAQNLFTLLKILGLALVVFAGVVAFVTPSTTIAVQTEPRQTDFGLALVFVLYAFGGWSHAAYVAAEVRDERRNIPRALMLGILGVTLVYLAVTAAYLLGLGFDAASQTSTPATDVVEHIVGPWGGRAISFLVMLSALGAINGMILTGTRVYATLGSDYPPLAWLGTWNRRDAAPIAAIATQAVASVALVLLVGTAVGRDLCDAVIRTLNLDPVDWKDFLGGFELLVAGSAPVFWTFFLLTGLSVFQLRRKYPTIERPFRIPLFPLPPVVFCMASAYMLYSSLAYAEWLSLIGIVPLTIGAIVWLFIRRTASTN
jgi:basic amino acid/polyamine antiporter, APA family